MVTAGGICYTMRAMAPRSPMTKFGKVQPRDDATLADLVHGLDGLGDRGGRAIQERRP